MNYAKNIESIQSNINVMAGYSWQHFYYRDLSIYKSNVTENLGTKEGWTYNDDEGRYIQNNNTPSPWENYLVSFFGRLNYNFKERYLLTATLRQDGSSRFSKSNRWDSSLRSVGMEHYQRTVYGKGTRYYVQLETACRIWCHRSAGDYRLSLYH
ncbi:hypothetical protein BFINE_03550 [Bacteroides finegoldii DSM 17565]|nr:hypothetical protein BFINE_03550 [Bacteroides finegoldii DSM 17565]